MRELLLVDEEGPCSVPAVVTTDAGAGATGNDPAAADDGSDDAARWKRRRTDAVAPAVVRLRDWWECWSALLSRLLPLREHVLDALASTLGALSAAERRRLRYLAQCLAESYEGEARLNVASMSDSKGTAMSIWPLLDLLERCRQHAARDPAPCPAPGTGTPSR